MAVWKDQCELLGQILIDSLPDGIIGELSKKRLEIGQELPCRFRISFLVCFCEADVFLVSFFIIWSCFGIHFYPPNSVRRRPSQTVTTFWKYYDRALWLPYHVFCILYISVNFAYIVASSFEAPIFTPFKRGPLRFFTLTVSLLFWKHEKRGFKKRSNFFQNKSFYALLSIHQ